MTERRRYRFMETSGIKWLLDRRNALILEGALLKYEFEVVPPTEEEVVNFENRIKRFTKFDGCTVTVESSRISGYLIVSWTKAAESLVADEFGGFHLFYRARKTDLV